MSTREEALARALAAFENINASKTVVVGSQASKAARVHSAAKEAGVTIVHTVTNRLGAILPIGMTANKLAKVVEANREIIEGFKNGNQENLKL